MIRDVIDFENAFSLFLITDFSIYFEALTTYD